MKRKRDFRVTGNLAKEVLGLSDMAEAIKATEKEQLVEILKVRKENVELGRKWWAKVMEEYNLDKDTQYTLSTKNRRVRVVEE